MSMKEEVVEMKNEIKNLRKETQESTFAMDLFRELKSQNKRLFIIILVLITVIVTIITAYFIRESQFETILEETTVDAGNGTATYLENSNSGDINYGENN